MAVDMSQIFSKLAMPSPEFLRKDRFEPVANGSIYVGKTDTDPENEANQIPVYFEQEDGSLVQVNQPISINTSGYPVYNGKPGKFITHTAASMKVLDVNGVEQWYWPNLFEYDSSQMWAVLASSFGADFIGTPVGTIQEQLNGYVTPWNFVGKAPYANQHEAIQAMLDYAAANKKMVWATGYTLNTNGILTGHDIKIVGGTWILAGNDPRFTNCELIGGRWEGRSIWTKNTTIRDCWLEKCRVRHDGGDVRVLDTRLNGEVAGSNVTSIVIQGSQPGQEDPVGTIEVDGCIFSNGLNGILHQGGHADMTSGIYRNLTFLDMKGDAIELNVVNSTYNEGLVIENILINNINATLAGSNWGIGIGIAGMGPYAWDADDSMYCHDFTIRNVLAIGVRQPIHVEVGRDFTIENCRVYPDVNKSVGTGLRTAGVYVAGSKNFTIDGISGECVGSASVPATDLDLVHVTWGTAKDDVRKIPASRNYAVRNVYTRNGGVELSCDAYPGFGTIPPQENRVMVSGVDCYRFSALGVATHLSLTDITCKVFDCWGDLSAGGHGASSGLTISTRAVLDMVNVNAYGNGAGMVGSQVYNRCRYSNVNRIGGNVQADSWVNIDGALGALLATVGRVFYPQITAHGGYGNFFPCGREFEEGDQVWVFDYGGNDPADGVNGIVGMKPYLVTSPGAYFPTDDRSKVHAAAAGATKLVQFLTPTGTSTGSPWLYTTMLSPGTRIRVPTSAGNQVVTVVRSPYQTPPDDTSKPIVIDITPPLIGSVAEGAKITMAQQIQTIPRIPANSP